MKIPKVFRRGLLARMGFGLATAFFLYFGSGCRNEDLHESARIEQVDDMNPNNNHNSNPGDWNSSGNSNGIYPREITNCIDESVKLEDVPLIAQDNSNVDYLVVTYPEMKTSSSLDRLVDFRSTEFNTNIVDVNEINAEYPGEVTGALDKFVRDVYNVGKGALKYILLVGKRDKVPAKFFGDINFDAGDSDNYIGDVGCMTNPEIAVGRLPVNDESDLENIVGKIIDFEGNKTRENSNNIFVAGADFGNIFSGYGFDEFFEKVAVPLVPYNKNIIKIYESDSNEDAAKSQELIDNLIETINNGAFFVGYQGHGNGYDWGNTNFQDFGHYELSKLNNIIYPVVLASACQTAALTNSTSQFNSVGEEFVNMGHGASAYIGARSSVGGLEYFDRAFYERLFSDEFEFERIGNILIDSQKYDAIAEKYYTGNVSVEMNLFGDPAMRVKSNSNR